MDRMVQCKYGQCNGRNCLDCEEAAEPAPRSLAVRCRDGCGWRGRRLWPGAERPCPQCGARIDVGRPERIAVVTVGGGLGGRTQLVWSDW